jgi:hypothetical protein
MQDDFQIIPEQAHVELPNLQGGVLTPPIAELVG